MQVGEVATGAGPPNFGPDGTAMGAGFEYPPVARPEAEKKSPKECFRSIFAAEGEGCEADNDDDSNPDDSVDSTADDLDDGIDA